MIVGICKKNENVNPGCEARRRSRNARPVIQATAELNATFLLVQVSLKSVSGPGCMPHFLFSIRVGSILVKPKLASPARCAAQDSKICLARPDTNCSRQGDEKFPLAFWQFVWPLLFLPFGSSPPNSGQSYFFPQSHIHLMNGGGESRSPPLVVEVWFVANGSREGGRPASRGGQTRRIIQYQQNNSVFNY